MRLPAALKFRYLAIDPTHIEQIERNQNWLGPAECRELERLKDAGRRSQWLAGRWLAKELIAETVDKVDRSDLQVLTRDAHGRSVRPQLSSRSCELPLNLSISHTERGAVVVLSASRWFSVGVDLVPAGVVADDGFCRLWFNSIERQWLDHDPSRRASILWAVKEAVYKAANLGHSWNPRQVEVRPRRPSGFECSYRGRRLEGLTIQLDEIGGETVAVACMPRSARTWHVERRSHARPAAGPHRAKTQSKKTRFVVVGINR